MEQQNSMQNENESGEKNNDKKRSLKWETVEDEPDFVVENVESKVNIFCNTGSGVQRKRSHTLVDNNYREFVHVMPSSSTMYMYRKSISDMKSNKGDSETESETETEDDDDDYGTFFSAKRIIVDELERKKLQEQLSQQQYNNCTKIPTNEMGSITIYEEEAEEADEEEEEEEEVAEKEAEENHDAKENTGFVGLNYQQVEADCELMEVDEIEDGVE